MDAEQQRRHIGVADDDLGIALECSKIEVGQQGVGVAAANHRHDAAHLGVADKGVELLGPRGDGAGAPVILLAGEAARLEPKALPFKKGLCTGKTGGRPGGCRTGGEKKAMVLPRLSCGARSLVIRHISRGSSKRESRALTISYRPGWHNGWLASV